MNRKSGLLKSVSLLVLFTFISTTTVAYTDMASVDLAFKSHEGISHARPIPTSNVYSRAELRQLYQGREPLVPTVEPSVQSITPKSKTADPEFFSSYDGAVYYPAGELDLYSLKALAKLFPKVKKFVYADAFYPGENSVEVISYDHIDVMAENIKRALESDLNVNMQRDVGRVSVEIVSKARKELKILLVFKDNENVHKWLRGREFEIQYFVQDVRSVSGEFDVVYVQTPGLAGGLAKTPEFWHKIAQQTKRFLLVSDVLTPSPPDTLFTNTGFYDPQYSLGPSRIAIYEPTAQRPELRSNFAAGMFLYSGFIAYSAFVGISILNSFVLMIRSSPEKLLPFIRRAVMDDPVYQKFYRTERLIEPVLNHVLLIAYWFLAGAAVVNLVSLFGFLPVSIFGGIRAFNQNRMRKLRPELETTRAIAKMVSRFLEQVDEIALSVAEDYVNKTLDLEKSSLTRFLFSNSGHVSQNVVQEAHDILFIVYTTVKNEMTRKEFLSLEPHQLIKLMEKKLGEQYGFSRSELRSSKADELLKDAIIQSALDLKKLMPYGEDAIRSPEFSRKINRLVNGEEADGAVLLIKRPGYLPKDGEGAVAFDYVRQAMDFLEFGNFLPLNVEEVILRSSFAIENVLQHPLADDSKSRAVFLIVIKQPYVYSIVIDSGSGVDIERALRAYETKNFRFRGRGFRHSFELLTHENAQVLIESRGKVFLSNSDGQTFSDSPIESQTRGTLWVSRAPLTESGAYLVDLHSKKAGKSSLTYIRHPGSKDLLLPFVAHDEDQDKEQKSKVVSPDKVQTWKDMQSIVLSNEIPMVRISPNSEEHISKIFNDFVISLDQMLNDAGKAFLVALFEKKQLGEWQVPIPGKTLQGYLASRQISSFIFIKEVVEQFLINSRSREQAVPGRPQRILVTLPHLPDFVLKTKNGDEFLVRSAFEVLHQVLDMRSELRSETAESISELVDVTARNQPPFFFNSATADQNKLLDGLRRFVQILKKGSKVESFHSSVWARSHKERIHIVGTNYPGVKLTFIAHPPARFIKKAVIKPKSKQAGLFIVEIYHTKDADPETKDLHPIGIIAGNLQTRSNNLFHIFFVQLSEKWQGKSIMSSAFHHLKNSLPERVTDIELNILHFSTLADLAYHASLHDPEWAREFHASDLVIKQDFAGLYNALIVFLKKVKDAKTVSKIFPADFLKRTEEGALLAEAGFPEPRLGFREYESRQVPGEIRADLHIVAKRLKIKDPAKKAEMPKKKKPEFLENEIFVKALFKSPLSFLDERRKKVLELHYGLNGIAKRLALKDIAPLVDVKTRERVRQLEAQGMRIAKAFYESELWKDREPVLLSEIPSDVQEAVYRYIFSLLPRDIQRKAAQNGAIDAHTLLFKVPAKSFAGEGKRSKDVIKIIRAVKHRFIRGPSSAKPVRSLSAKPDSTITLDSRSELRTYFTKNGEDGTSDSTRFIVSTGRDWVSFSDFFNHPEIKKLLESYPSAEFASFWKYIFSVPYVNTTGRLWRVLAESAINDDEVLRERQLRFVLDAPQSEEFSEKSWRKWEFRFSNMEQLIKQFTDARGNAQDIADAINSRLNRLKENWALLEKSMWLSDQESADLEFAFNEIRAALKSPPNQHFPYFYMSAQIQDKQESSEKSIRALLVNYINAALNRAESYAADKHEFRIFASLYMKLARIPGWLGWWRQWVKGETGFVLVDQMYLKRGENIQQNSLWYVRRILYFSSFALGLSAISAFYVQPSFFGWTLALTPFILMPLAIWSRFITRPGYSPKFPIYPVTDEGIAALLVSKEILSRENARRFLNNEPPLAPFKRSVNRFDYKKAQKHFPEFINLKQLAEHLDHVEEEVFVNGKEFQFHYQAFWKDGSKPTHIMLSYFSSNSLQNTGVIPAKAEDIVVYHISQDNLRSFDLKAMLLWIILSRDNRWPAHRVIFDEAGALDREIIYRMNLISDRDEEDFVTKYIPALDEDQTELLRQFTGREIRWISKLVGASQAHSRAELRTEENHPANQQRSKISLSDRTIFKRIMDRLDSPDPELISGTLNRILTICQSVARRRGLDIPVARGVVSYFAEGAFNDSHIEALSHLYALLYGQMTLALAAGLKAPQKRKRLLILKVLKRGAETSPHLVQSIAGSDAFKSNSVRLRDPDEVALVADINRIISRAELRADNKTDSNNFDTEKRQLSEKLHKLAIRVDKLKVEVAAKIQTHARINDDYNRGAYSNETRSKVVQLMMEHRAKQLAITEPLEFFLSQANGARERLSDSIKLNMELLREVIGKYEQIISNYEKLRALINETSRHFKLLLENDRAELRQQAAVSVTQNLRNFPWLQNGGESWAPGLRPEFLKTLKTLTVGKRIRAIANERDISDAALRKQLAEARHQKEFRLLRKVFKLKRYPRVNPGLSAALGNVLQIDPVWFLEGVSLKDAFIRLPPGSRSILMRHRAGLKVEELLLAMKKRFPSLQRKSFVAIDSKLDRFESNRRNLYRNLQFREDLANFYNLPLDSFKTDSEIRTPIHGVIVHLLLQAFVFPEDLDELKQAVQSISPKSQKIITERYVKPLEIGKASSVAPFRPARQDKMDGSIINISKARRAMARSQFLHDRLNILKTVIHHTNLSKRDRAAFEAQYELNENKAYHTKEAWQRFKKKTGNKSNKEYFLRFVRNATYQIRQRMAEVMPVLKAAEKESVSIFEIQNQLKQASRHLTFAISTAVLNPNSRSGNQFPEIAMRLRDKAISTALRDLDIQNPEERLKKLLSNLKIIEAVIDSPDFEFGNKEVGKSITLARSAIKEAAAVAKRLSDEKQGIRAELRSFTQLYSDGPSDDEVKSKTRKQLVETLIKRQFDQIEQNSLSRHQVVFESWVRAIKNHLLLDFDGALWVHLHLYQGVDKKLNYNQYKNGLLFRLEVKDNKPVLTGVMGEPNIESGPEYEVFLPLENLVSERMLQWIKRQATELVKQNWSELKEFMLIDSPARGTITHQLGAAVSPDDAKGLYQMLRIGESEADGVVYGVPVPKIYRKLSGITAERRSELRADYFSEFSERLRQSEKQALRAALHEKFEQLIQTAGIEYPRLLDLGAGSGELTQAIAGLFKEAVAVEKDVKRVDELKKRKIPNTQAVSQDFFAADIMGNLGAFDGILISHSLIFEPFEKRDALLKQALGKLSSSGRLAIALNSIRPEPGTSAHARQQFMKRHVFGGINKSRSIEETIKSWGYSAETQVVTVTHITSSIDEIVKMIASVLPKQDRNELYFHNRNLLIDYANQYLKKSDHRFEFKINFDILWVSQIKVSSRSELKRDSGVAVDAEFENLDSLNAIEPEAWKAGRESLRKAETVVPEATSETKSALGGELGIDLNSNSSATANGANASTLIGFSPSVVRDPARFIAAARIIDGKVPLVAFVGTEWERSELRRLFPKDHNVLIVTQANINEIMRRIPGKARMILIGENTEEDMRYFHQLEKLFRSELRGRLELVPKLFNMSHLDKILGIGALAEGLRSELRKTWATAVAA